MAQIPLYSHQREQNNSMGKDMENSAHSENTHSRGINPTPVYSWDNTVSMLTAGEVRENTSGEAGVDVLRPTREAPLRCTEGSPILQTPKPGLLSWFWGVTVR